MQIFLNTLSGFATTASLSLPTRKFIQTRQEPIAQVTTEPVLLYKTRTLCIKTNPPKTMSPKDIKEYRDSANREFEKGTLLSVFQENIAQINRDCWELRGQVLIQEFIPRIPGVRASIPQTLNTTSFELTNTQPNSGLTSALQQDFTVTNKTLKQKQLQNNSIRFTAKRAPSLIS